MYKKLRYRSLFVARTSELSSVRAPRSRYYGIHLRFAPILRGGDWAGPVLSTVFTIDGPLSYAIFFLRVPLPRPPSTPKKEKKKWKENIPEGRKAGFRAVQNPGIVRVPSLARGFDTFRALRVGGTFALFPEPPVSREFRIRVRCHLGVRTPFQWREELFRLRGLRVRPGRVRWRVCVRAECAFDGPESEFRGPRVHRLAVQRPGDRRRQPYFCWSLTVIPGQTPVTVTYTFGNFGAYARCRELIVVRVISGNSGAYAHCRRFHN